MAGKFEIFTDASGKFRWRLKAGNGEIIAQSQAYETKETAKKGIASVQTNAADAALVDLTTAAK
ncbi:YegP family protein [Nocardia asteroides]|uniref:YegP family protein n=1 Tax=Nocardia asteroides TaxID=1824 RepID=UPI0033FBA8F8